MVNCRRIPLGKITTVDSSRVVTDVVGGSIFTKAVFVGAGFSIRFENVQRQL